MSNKSDEENIVHQLQYNIEELNNNKFIYKSNNLIESSYNLSLNGQRLINMAVKKLKPLFITSKLKPSELNTLKGITEFKEITIHANEFKREYGLKGNNVYTALVQVVDSIYNDTLNYYEDGKYTKIRWTYKCVYDKNNNLVKMKFSPDLILDLLVFKSEYGKLEYDSCRRLNTGHSIRIYELCKSFAYKGERIVSVEDLKFKLGLKAESYPKFGMFRQKVLDPSLKSINENTDIIVDIELLRKGRKIEFIKFNIKYKIIIEENQISINDENAETIKAILNIISKYSSLKITERQALKIADLSIEALKKYKIDKSVEEYIKEKIEVSQNYSKIKKEEVGIGYLIRAIENNWTTNIIFDEKKVDNFNNYDQREYDLTPGGEFEKKLLGWDKDDKES